MFSCEFLEIIKDTFFVKHLRATASSTGKIPMIAGWRYHFSAFWDFSFWLIAFSWTLPWNVGTLTSNFLQKSDRIHQSSQEFYLCYPWYVFHVCYYWKGCKSLITTCYLHDFFLYSFHIILASDDVISFDACRIFLIIFLFLLNILIINLFLSRYFCAVCSCYAQILECLNRSMAFSAHIEILFLTILYTQQNLKGCVVGALLSKSADWC